MDFTLIPICYDNEHIMRYKHKEDYYCDICNKQGVSYCCDNCDYYRCRNCHRDLLAEEEIKERLRLSKLKNEFKLAELNLKNDNLEDWEVMISDGEILYINKLTKTYSYDYPLYISPSLSDREIKTHNDDRVRCTFTELINTIKSFF